MLNLFNKSLDVRSIFILGIGLLSFNILAAENPQLSTTIHINQNSQGVFVRVQLDGSSLSNQTFKFSKKNKILSSSEVQIHENQNSDADYNLLTTQQSHIELSYQMLFETADYQYLTEDLNWYPRVEDENLNQIFILSSDVVQGYQFIHSATGQSQSGVNAVLGRFTLYEKLNGKLKVYLQNPDEVLAETLLKNLQSYLENYETQLGSYPYDYFSVVESSDEIGYAFPKMTWIGSRLLRFPFILTTSLPHELLHSWWGNSVFVDYNLGNWCEGLTVFGADYALLDNLGKKAYRQKSLIEYLDYVKTENEISLSQFTSRGEDRSLQAIGYNKSLMMFVMLEQLVGEKIFKKSLKLFNQKYQFKKASYANLFDVIKQVQAEDGFFIDLNSFFHFWIESKGTVDLSQMKLNLSNENMKHNVSILLSDEEKNKINNLQINIWFKFEDGSVQKSKMSLSQSLQFEKKPIEYAIDPDFFLFRKLSESEKPLSFSKLFGATDVSIMASESSVNSFKETFKQVVHPLTSLSGIDFNQAGQIVIEDYKNGMNGLIDAALKQKEIELGSDQIGFHNQFVPLQQNAYFIAVKIKSKDVYLYKLNDSLPIQRWFQRWARYGAQGYLVLTPTSAAKQILESDVVFNKF